MQVRPGKEQRKEQRKESRGEQRKQQPRLVPQQVATPIRRLTDPRLDLPGPVALRKSYIVASTDRSGSTFLCSMLWQTGILGAPAEYWNYRGRAGAKPIGTQMMERLGASSPEDYLKKLLACRTSKNGIFGVKVHSFDFREALRKFPTVLEMMSPTSYIHIRRKDKVAQAVSMAKATQTGAWVARAEARTENLQYDRDLIAKCLGFVERQDRDWVEWFENKRIDPFVVTYENLTADPAGVVRGVIELLDVQRDKRRKVNLADAEKQGDETNAEWVARFRRENQADRRSRSSDRPAAAAKVAAMPPAAKGNRVAAHAHVFDRYDEIKDSAARPVYAKRQRHRYAAIVDQNRKLFQDARVLNVHSGDGRWSLAALDAGAAHVLGVESEPAQVEAARSALARLAVEPASYEFRNEEVIAALRSLPPESFDLVLCQEFSRLADPHLFFNRLHLLRPKHIILDTAIIAGRVPMLSFRLREPDRSGPGDGSNSAAIRALPTHELIRLLSDYFDFRWRVIDWRELGITDWTGVRDYERGWHRTYVLDRAA